MGFDAFTKAVPDKDDSMQLVMTRTGEDCLSVVVVLDRKADRSEKDGVRNIKPLVLNGTFADLDKGFFPALNQYHEVICQHLDNMKLIEEQVKAAEEAKKKASKPVGAGEKQRLSGPLDHEALLCLTTLPPSDSNFKGALEKASMLTLLEAAKDLHVRASNKSAFSKVSSELKKVTGKGADHYGIGVAEPEQPDTAKGKPGKTEEKNGAQQSLFGGGSSLPPEGDGLEDDDLDGDGTENGEEG